MGIYRNITLIYNPAAGGMRWRRGLPARVAGVLTQAGHGVTIVPTVGPGSAGRLARERIEAGTDLIVSLGGDGTLNEVLPGVVHTDVPVAVIPAGTANVLAREIGIGTNSERAARQLEGWVPARIAAGLLKCAPERLERYFLLMAGVGFDAHIVYQLNLPLKARLGEFAYWTSSLHQVFRKLEEFEVEVNGELFLCSFALATRVRNYAGYLQIARKVSLVKPEFELVLFEGNSTLRSYLRYLWSVLRGHSNVKGMYFLKTTQASFSEPTDARVYVQVDGEYAGHLPASVEIVPEAVTLLVPPAYLKRS